MSSNTVNRYSHESVFIQISRIIEGEIANIHQPGDYLPSENELAKRFNVNRHTIRRAIDVLVDAGIVARSHGKGTLVLEPPLKYAIDTGARFTEKLEALGRNTDSTILRKLVIPAGNGVSRRLGINVGDPVIWIETLRQVDDVPFCVISHFISKERYPSLEEAYQGGSLHKVIRESFGISIRRTESLITALPPYGDDAGVLRMPQAMPVLRVKSLNVNAENDEPVEYAVTRFRSDRVELAVML